MARADRASRYAVVLAGGFGSRFWPRSRRTLPKQFLPVRGRRTLLQETVRRLRGVVPPARILVVAPTEFVGLIRKQVPTLGRHNVLVEPDARGTAPCLALAAAEIERRDANAVMAVFPADHDVTDVDGFRRAIRAGFRTAASERSLVTFGVAPAHAETGYGYIELGRRFGRTVPSAHWVARFHEKPDRRLAQAYLRGGRHLWNSGMFVWRVDVLAEAVRRHAPEISRAVTLLVDGRGSRRSWPARGRRAYCQLDTVSIDVAVMERAERVAVVRADFGWSDVGSWAAMADLWGTDADGNAVQGDTLLLDCRGTVVAGTTRLVAVLGVDDLIVVDGGDALLVCPRSRAQDVRRIVDELAAARRRELL